MQRKYETVCIVRPDAGDEIVKGVIQKAKSAIEAGAGILDKLDEWGRRRLAYQIAKKHEGHYFVIYYTCEPTVSKEVERILKLNEDVLRYQTIVIVDKKIKKKKPRKKKPQAAEVRVGSAPAGAAAPAGGNPPVEGGAV